ncbi:MAG: hypothetical protein ACJA2M_000510 [Polaribacter sp.]|mgnify:CR=1 FL=1|jgi:hypothetical protein
MHCDISFKRSNAQASALCSIPVIHVRFKISSQCLKFNIVYKYKLMAFGTFAREYL